MVHKHGVWLYPKNYLQTTEGREPLLTWKPKMKASHPMDYFVPNFGKDSDMIHAQKHIGITEQKMKHQWKPTKDDDDKWVVPKEASRFTINKDDHLAMSFA